MAPELTLEALRDEIDRLDEVIVKLLDRRAFRRLREYRADLVRRSIYDGDTHIVRFGLETGTGQQNGDERRHRRSAPCEDMRVPARLDVATLSQTEFIESRATFVQQLQGGGIEVIRKVSVLEHR